MNKRHAETRWQKHHEKQQLKKQIEKELEEETRKDPLPSFFGGILSESSQESSINVTNNSSV